MDCLSDTSELPNLPFPLGEVPIKGFILLLWTNYRFLPITQVQPQFLNFLMQLDFMRLLVSISVCQCKQGSQHGPNPEVLTQPELSLASGNFG